VKVATADRTSHDTPPAATAEDLEVPSGLAHVATASFLASRISPTAGFWIALAGGLALARIGQERGARIGYGASIAAMLQTVAVMGPIRFGVPFTQALTAPLLGRLEARGRSASTQILACAAIRLVQTAIFVAFAVLVLVGGVDAYTDTYDSVASWMPLLPEGTRAALIATGVGLLAWAAFASTVQVLVYRRGLHGWPPDSAGELRDAGPEPSDPGHRRFDPRAVALAAAIAFALLLSSTRWPLLVGVAAWLAIAWWAARGDRDVIGVGLAIAGTLALGIFVFAMTGGAGFDLALRRASRASLLVLVATWLRAAAGAPGLREVSRRTLRRLRALPATHEASIVLDELGTGRQLVPAAGSLLEELRPVPKTPIPVLDAVFRWVVAESARFRAVPHEVAARLRARPIDGFLVLLALAPLAVFAV
jgi:hypothetical protein